MVDTGSQDLNNHDRIELIFHRHGEFARKYSLPMLVGEWGAFHPEEQAVSVALFTVKQFDALACGDTFWAYRRSLATSPLLPALARHPARLTQ